MELFLCVIYRSPNSTNDNNKQLLDLIVELRYKRVDELLLYRYRYRYGIHIGQR